MLVARDNAEMWIRCRWTINAITNYNWQPDCHQHPRDWKYFHCLFGKYFVFRLGKLWSRWRMPEQVFTVLLINLVSWSLHKQIRGNDWNIFWWQQWQRMGRGGWWDTWGGCSAVYGGDHVRSEQGSHDPGSSSRCLESRAETNCQLCQPDIVHSENFALCALLH